MTAHFTKHGSVECLEEKRREEQYVTSAGVHQHDFPTIDFERRTMALGTLKPKIPAFKAKPFHFWKALKELDMFFREDDPVHQTMRRVVKRLDEAGISYAIMGGMAVFAHKHRRATNDVDILVTQEGFEEFSRRHVPKSYKRVGKKPRRFADRVNTVTVDFLITGRYPGTGRPGPIPFPHPDDVSKRIRAVWHVNLEALIELKLAARRWQDFADVVNLIRANKLDKSFADRLHESVRSDYIECLEEKRREEEYEALG